MGTETHRVNCKCPICRSARGERTREKINFTACVSPLVLSQLRDWARRHDTSLSDAVTAAVNELMAKDQQEKDNFRKMPEADSDGGKI